MINLMYVVLMAMLALNVSTEVLNGFSIVEESLSRTTANSAKENQVIYDDFSEQLKANPAKVKAWFDKAQTVRRMSDSLYNFADELKVAIVKEADGEDGDVKNIVGKEDLEVTDPTQKAIISSNLSTDVPRNIQTMGKNWQEYMFEDMPVAAAVTLLSKLQSDVRYAEGEVLHTLVSNIDLKDIRVNSLNAFVIPNSQTIVRGDKFSAHIVMAAVDTTQVPEIYIGNRKMNLKDGLYETVCSRTGDFTLAGYIEMLNGNGERVRRDFSQKYTVVDPSATVSADLMNMLYAGYSNPISVSVPGVPLNKVTATMTGGTLQPVGPGRYIARPTAIGKDVTITVSSTNTGRVQHMGQFTFRVRKLPDPTAYIAMADEHGNPTRYKGGGLPKASLMAADGIGAAIDDGILDIGFRVLSFETVFFDNMGNAVPMVSDGDKFSARQKATFRRLARNRRMVSDGDKFSARQKATFRRLARNRRFYISRVTAVGPDGLQRTLPTSMEVIIK